MKNTLFLFGNIVLAAILVLGGCSDDSSTNNGLTEGDYSDETYEQGKPFIEAFVDTTFESVDFALEYLSFDGTGPLSAAGDSFNINFDSETCWWEIYASLDSTGFSFTFIDSVKFQDAEGCQQFPDSNTTTEFEYRAYADIFSSDGQNSLIANAKENMLLTGIQSDLVVINATASVDIDFTYDYSSLMLNYDGSITDLTFSGDDIHSEGDIYPLAGAIALAMSVSTESPEGSGSVSWTVDVTFYVDHYHVRAESGNNYWEWDVVYGG